jgi:hypothetical protein
MATKSKTNLIISYLTMRRLIGILGMMLPFVVVLGGFIQTSFAIKSSISDYYYSNMRDFFVGLLCCVSLFLITYRGYDIIDDVLTNLCGIFALGIVAFPTSANSGEVVKVGVCLISDHISAFIHLSFAGLFFLLLSFNSIFLFTKHGTEIVSVQKRKRNIVYIVCGLLMFFSIVFIALYFLYFQESFLSGFHPVLIFETIALLAFGFSWLVKGGTLFRDKK